MPPINKSPARDASPKASALLHACGIRTAWTPLGEAEWAVEALAAAVPAQDLSHILAFFSPQIDSAALNAAFARLFPGVPIAGCTTSGSICPEGSLERGISIVAFPSAGFRIAAASLPSIQKLDVEGAASIVRGLRRELDADCVRKGVEGNVNRFALTLIDGLANVEETLVSALAWALDGIPLVGGSAGDDLRFADTELLFGGAVLRRAAVVLLVDTDFPVQLFKTDNFEPTGAKFVVTASDDEARIVREFNAEPAAREYAMAVGLDPDELTPMSFAAHPLVVKVGGEYFCRSIRNCNPDGSLSFFCAISEGVVMTLAEPRDMVQATRDELLRLEHSLGGLDLVVGFDCVLRRIDAEVRQVSRDIADLYRRFNVVGCETYGEQYRSMHLNQTFTGIAIGRIGSR